MNWKSYFQKTVGKAKQHIFREIKLESETPGEAGGDGQRWKLRGKGVDKRLLGQRASGCRGVSLFHSSLLVRLGLGQQGADSRAMLTISVWVVDNINIFAYKRIRKTEHEP